MGQPVAQTYLFVAFRAISMKISTPLNRSLSSEVFQLMKLFTCWNYNIRYQNNNSTTGFYLAAFVFSMSYFGDIFE